MSFGSVDPYARVYPLTSGSTSTRGGGRRGPTNFWTGPTSASRTIQFRLSPRLSLLDRARAGQRVEIGCYGGHGRTGTALACLAILCGQAPGEAVGWVRAGYCERAVETDEQEAFVRNFTS